LKSSRGRAALVAALTAASWIVVHPSPGTAATTCTIVGTAKSETLTGTSGNDVICGLGGDDVINAGGGDDRIDGGTGNDRISGGAGADVISGAAGNDTLTGGTGNDDLSGGDGTDTVSYADHTAAVSADLDGIRDDGSSGEKDYVTTSVENLTGGSGGDTLTGSAAANVLSGGGGNDTLNGGGGNDTLNGGGGNDKITGAAGADKLDGSTGTNVCDKDASDASVVNCPFDSTPPALTKYGLSTTKIDTSAGPKTVTATIGVTDNFSGVASVTAKLVGPATYTKAATFKSGSTWEAVITVPKDAPKGMYALHVGATDKQGNVLAPKDTTLQVEQVGDGDKTPPVLTKWAVDATTVDASEEAAEVTVTADVSDDNSGVATVTASLVGPATYSATATRTSGDAAAGSYQAVVTVPQGAAEGSYKLVIKATDADGNAMEKEVGTVTVGPLETEGEADPEPTGTDTTAPLARSWEVDRVAIDTSTGAEEVAVTARVTDAGSGVASVLFQLVGPGGTYSVTAARTAGDAADGTWEGMVTVPEGATVGAYTLHIGATDAAGNKVEPKATAVVVENSDG
jgi:hypothetical protein